MKHKHNVLLQILIYVQECSLSGVFPSAGVKLNFDQVPKMCSNVDKNKILKTILELIGMHYNFCGFYRCV